MSISAERRRQAFAQSITFDQFVEGSQHFTAEFRANYAAAVLDDADHEALARIPGPVDVLAIVEDWCPDVVANLPVLARAADHSDQVRLHVLIRGDGTRDVADAYPYEGRSHIPTYVISDETGAELGVFVERTPAVQEHVDAFLAAFFGDHPELDRATFPAGITDAQKAELTESSLRLRRNLRDVERASFIAAIADLASTRATDPLAASTAP